MTSERYMNGAQMEGGFPVHHPVSKHTCAWHQRVIGYTDSLSIWDQQQQHLSQLPGTCLMHHCKKALVDQPANMVYVYCCWHPFVWCVWYIMCSTTHWQGCIRLSTKTCPCMLHCNNAALFVVRILHDNLSPQVFWLWFIHACARIIQLQKRMTVHHYTAMFIYWHVAKYHHWDL